MEAPLESKVSGVPWTQVDVDRLHAQKWLESIRTKIKQGGPADLRVLRVSQLDAQELDSQLTTILGFQVKKMFKYLDGRLLEEYKPELEALLQLLVLRFTVFADVPSPGNQLQNLRYRNEAHPALRLGALNAPPPVVYRLTFRQKAYYALLFVGVRWLWTRLDNYMLINDWSTAPEDSMRFRVFRLMQYLRTVYRGASLLNLILFLMNGRYRSILDRVLRIRLVYIFSRVNRQVNFEYMNEQLVWQGFSEFLLFILPLMNFAKLKRSLVSWFSSLSSSPVDDGNQACPVCEADPITVPYRASCGHVFCYYCLSGSRLLDSVYRCPRCHKAITNMWRASAVGASGNVQRGGGGGEDLATRQSGASGNVLGHGAEDTEEEEKRPDDAVGLGS